MARKAVKQAVVGANNEGGQSLSEIVEEIALERSCRLGHSPHGHRFFLGQESLMLFREGR